MASSAAAAAAQSGREPIKVMARVRPRLAREDSYADVITMSGSGALTIRGGLGGVSSSRYRFDRVFGQHSKQEDVFGATEPLLASALNG